MAVADFQNPKITQNYAALLQSIRDLIYSQALMHDGTGVVNMPTGGIRYSATNKKWERFNGTAWVENSSSYNMNVTLLNGAGSSSAAAANTHVLRDSNGDLFTRYLNSVDNSVANGVTGLMCKAGDNYFRTATTGAVKTFLAYTGAEIITSGVDRTKDLGIAQHLRWQNFGNSHVLFDASAGKSPAGSTISNDNSTEVWQPTFINLMGWNGAGTYGVKVDRSRYSESTNPAAHRVQLNGITSGSAGSISIRGSTGSWAGIRFDDMDGTIVDNGTEMGYFRAGNWLWRYGASYGFVSTGNVMAYSDERLKKDWKEVAKDFVESWADLKHGIYTRIDSEIVSVGIGAQSLQKFLPEGVIETPDGVLAVNYGGATAIATVKLAQRVIQLQSQVEALEKAMDLLIRKLDIILNKEV